MVPIGATSTSFYALHCVLKGIYTQTKRMLGYSKCKQMFHSTNCFHHVSVVISCVGIRGHIVQV